MNQTWKKKKGKKTSFWATFAPKKFFNEFYLYFLLDIIASYHCIQFSEKLINKLEKMAKSPVSGPILASTRYYALLYATIACNFKEN